MSNYLLASGDTVVFLPNFGVAIVAVRPAFIKSSAKAYVNGHNVCVEGDEKQVMVMGCTYNTPTYVVPGIGNLSIKSLDSSQVSKLLKINNKSALLSVGQFSARFKVITPAQTPTVPTPTIDTTLEYSGNGKFITKNMKWQSK